MRLALLTPNDVLAALHKFKPELYSPNGRYGFVS